MKRKPAQRDIDKPEPCYVNYAILRADCELTLFRKAYPNKPISLARIDTHPGCSALWTLRRPTYPLVEQMVTSFPISLPGIAVLLHAINHDLLYPVPTRPHHTKPSAFPKLVTHELESEFRASPTDGIRKVIPSNSCVWVWEFGSF